MAAGVVPVPDAIAAIDRCWDHGGQGGLDHGLIPLPETCPGGHGDGDEYWGCDAAGRDGCRFIRIGRSAGREVRA